MHTLPILTASGVFVAAYSDRGLARLDFPGADNRAKLTGPKPPAPVRAWHRITARAVKQILAGQKPAALPPLDLTSGTRFQQAVWRALRGIRSGAAQSYGEIARTVGSPGAARAVGQACGANPIPLLIPCHRVLAAGGRLGGFSGGLDWKRRLLQREGVRPAR
jgi:methylated-DNA-[protein]-cysteine S-methyltransferase